MLNIAQFESVILQPTLDKLQSYSESAIELLKFTCAAESRGGTYLVQVKGPALGIYQMEPATYNDIWVNYLAHRNDLTTILALTLDNPLPSQANRMVYDLQLATAMARLHYKRVNEPLPAKGDVEGLFDYYKKYWNTEKGKAKKETSIKAYENFLQSK